MVANELRDSGSYARHIFYGSTDPQLLHPCWSREQRSSSRRPESVLSDCKSCCETSGEPAVQHRTKGHHGFSLFSSVSGHLMYVLLFWFLSRSSRAHSCRDRSYSDQRINFNPFFQSMLRARVLLPSTRTTRVMTVLKLIVLPTSSELCPSPCLALLRLVTTSSKSLPV